MNGSIKYNINISIKNNTRLKFSQQKPLNTAGQVKQKASKSSSAFFCLGFTVLDEALLCSFFSSTTLASSSVGELLQLARAQELYIEVCYQDTEVAIRRSRLAAAALAAAPHPGSGYVAHVQGGGYIISLLSRASLLSSYFP